VHGEKIVVRIMNFNRIRPDLNSLGYEAEDQLKLLEALTHPHGLILMTGPTGSGKTSSLYSCLDLINRPNINLATVEDPAEIELVGANQVSINEKAGLTFAVVLRALLRQDPDVIMIGEIRDLETAEIAIQASQTGHLVLSTLHTNDAPSTLARLRHMGIPSFHVASSLSLVTAQRLIRRLCELCKAPLSEQEARRLYSHMSNQRDDVRPQTTRLPSQIFKAIGCYACDKGYKGRIGLFQVMPVSAAMQTLILSDASTQALSALAAQEGVRTLRQAGWLKMFQGVTTMDEVMTLTPHE
jgi:type IV pilus assembly protein PilB